MCVNIYQFWSLKSRRLATNFRLYTRKTYKRNIILIKISRSTVVHDIILEHHNLIQSHKKLYSLSLDSQHRHPGVFHKRSLSNGMSTMQELVLVSPHHSTCNDTGNEPGDKLHHYTDKRQKYHQ